MPKRRRFDFDQPVRLPAPMALQGRQAVQVPDVTVQGPAPFTFNPEEAARREAFQTSRNELVRLGRTMTESMTPFAAPDDLTEIPGFLATRLHQDVLRPAGRAASRFLPSAGTLGKLGLALEAFGAGVQGRTPLLAQIQEQERLARESSQDRAVKLAQLQDQRLKFDFERVKQALAETQGNPKARKELLTKLHQNGNTQADLFRNLPDKTVSQIPALLGPLRDFHPEFLKEYQERAKEKKLNDPSFAAKTEFVVEDTKQRVADLRKTQVQAQRQAALEQKARNPDTGQFDQARLNPAERQELVNIWREDDKLNEQLAEQIAKRKTAQTQARVTQATEPEQIQVARTEARSKALELQFEEETFGDRVREAQNQGAKLVTAVVDDQGTRQVFELNPLTQELEPLRDADGKLIKGKPTAPSVNIDLRQEKAFEAELGKLQAKVVMESLEGAEDASSLISTTREGLALLDAGVITGFGADWVVSLGQALRRIGFNVNDDPLANSQAFAATMAQNVAKVIKQFGAGTGLSDADREFAEKMVGGNITLEEKSIRKILDIQERAARNVIQAHNAKVKEIKTKPSLVVPEPPPLRPAETTRERPSAKDRFNDLIESGLSEAEAYRRLAEEGF